MYFPYRTEVIIDVGWISALRLRLAAAKLGELHRDLSNAAHSAWQTTSSCTWPHMRKPEETSVVNQRPTLDRASSEPLVWHTRYRSGRLKPIVPLETR